MSVTIGYVKRKGTCTKCKGAARKNPGSANPHIEKDALFWTK
jgi:hypothetical protein